MVIDFSNQNSTQRYKLISQLVIPRPIAWIVSGQEVINIAPFSYFTPLSSEPATVVVSIGHRPNKEPKDTLRNIRAFKKCVICMSEASTLEALDASATSLDASQSEAQVFDIATEKIFEHFPPIIKGVKTALFCEYLQEIDLKGSSTVPLILEIKHLYIDKSIVSDAKKMYLKLDAVARVGKGYASLQELPTLTTP